MRRVQLTLLLLLVLPWPAVNAAPFQAGLATTDITPPVGWRMSGYFYERLSTGIHDPLQAKAIVLRHGEDRAALVFCDLIGMPGFISGEVRERASHKTGIPRENILIAATHTHTGPLFFGALREYLHTRAVENNREDLAERVDYRGILIDRLVSVITKADLTARPVEIYVGKTNVSGLSFNRRYRMKNGLVQFNPGKTNENIVGPAGPTDSELFFLAFKRKSDRKLVGGLTSYALHADTVGGTNYGADFPGHLAHFLKGVIGEDFVSCFGNAPCGDINHVNVADPTPQKGDAEAERIGRLLGRKAADLLPRLRPIEPVNLAVADKPVRVPLQQYSAEQIAQARADLAKVGTKDLPFLRQVEACKIMDLQWRWPGATHINLEVQAFRLGRDTVIVGLPGEIFCELGMALKKRSPFKNTIIVELANESLGYVPTEKAFREGSYEVTNSRLKPGGGEMLVEAAVQLLKGM